MSHVEWCVVRLSVKKRNKTEKREKKGQRYRESERMGMIRLMDRLPHPENRRHNTDKILYEYITPVILKFILHRNKDVAQGQMYL